VPPKNDIDFLKKRIDNISLLSHHIIRQEKKGEKRNTPFFPQPPNPTQEITPGKE
jgi:hypothetical protein